MVSSSLEVNVGERIRELRKQQHLTLRALAARCGLSANAISLIERGETSPTLASLQQLAQALDVPVTELFRQGTDRQVVHVKHNCGKRIQYTGVLLESLGEGLAQRQFEVMRLVVEPGSCTSETPLSHPGQEFVYCLEGNIEYLVGGQRYHLAPGDSLMFESELPHSWHNTTDAPAAMLLVLPATQRHTVAH